MQIIQFIKQDIQTVWQKYWGLTLTLALLFAFGSAYSFPLKTAKYSVYVSTQGTLSRTCKLTVFAPTEMVTFDVRGATIWISDSTETRRVYTFIHGKKEVTTKLAVDYALSDSLTEKLVKCIQHEDKKGDVLPSEFSTLIDHS